MAYPEPPWWGLAIGLIGRLLVYAACACFAASALLSLRNSGGGGSRRRSPFVWLFSLGAAALVVSMGCLVALLLLGQFEFDYVWRNTSVDTPWMYRLSAAWASQEGSLLLWSVTSSLIVALWFRYVGPQYQRYYTLIAAILMFCIAGILCYESPFRLLDIEADLLAELPAGQTLVMPPDGLGLNPVLQNYWMVIHPWVIFLGFGSLLPLFALGNASAFSKDRTDWIRAVRSLAILAASLLGAGIVMGGLWAYETLGWGGFWAWDPVENVSLVPFVTVAALIHALFLQANRKSFEATNPVLASMPFVWFAYGTYLARSGQLANVSVHSFAQMDPKAHYLLLAMVAIALILFIAVAVVTLRTRSKQAAAGGSRSLAMTAGVFLLYAVGILAAVGMSVPFLATLFGDGRKSVISEATFNRITVWPLVPILLLMAIAPILGWSKTSASRRKQILLCLLMSGTITLLTWALLRHWGDSVALHALLGLTFFALACNVLKWIEAIKTRRNFGAYVVHSGIALTLFGLIASRGFEQTSFGAISATESASIALGTNRLVASLAREPSASELLSPENKVTIGLTDTITKERIALQPVLFYQQGVATEDVRLIARPSIVRNALQDLYLSVNGRETSFAMNVEAKLRSPVSVRIGDEQAIVTLVRAKAGADAAADFSVTYRNTTSSVHVGRTTASGQHHALSEVVGNDFIIRLDSIEPDKAVISFLCKEPIYLIEVFRKPFTSLVWLGAFLFVLGGIISFQKTRLMMRQVHLPPQGGTP